MMVKGSKNYLPFLPFFAGIFQFSLAASSYAIGVLFNKSLDYLPYPSDLAEEQPERGLLNVSLGFGGALTFSVILLRYIQINSLYPIRRKKLNMASLTCGIFMVLGQTLMSSFSRKEIDRLYYFSACLYSTFACCYMFSQTHLSRVLVAYHSPGIIKLRVCCSVLSSLCPVGYILARMFASEKQHHYRIPHGAEWLLTFLTIIFTCSFCWDFNRIKFRSYILDKAISNELGMRGTNYIDYLRNQARSRKISNGLKPYHVNSKC